MVTKPLAMHKKLDEIIDYDLYEKAIFLLQFEIDRKKSPVEAFGEAVVYIKNKTDLPLKKIEQALATSLLDIYRITDNPFLGIISYVRKPTYIKTLWTVENWYKRRKVEFLITTTMFIAVLIFTNPSISSYRDHVSLKYKIPEHYLSSAIMTARTGNFLIFSIYSDSRHGKAIGILDNFIDI